MSRAMVELKGVLIDFGDTLAHIDENGNREYQEALLSVVNESGCRENLKNLTSTLNDVIRNSMKGEFKNMQEFWNHFAKRLNVPMEAVLVEKLENVRTTYSSRIFQLYNGVPSVLSLLHGKYQMALVSNCAVGTSDAIEALGLTDYFECFVLSYEVGVRKPHRQLYIKALRCLGLEPSECVFVADEISDLEGAREVGMQTILVRQGTHTFHQARDRNFQPDFQCSRISDITGFL